VNVDTNGFALGDVVRDTITGLEGTITGIHLYTTGCARVTIQARIGSDGKVPEGAGSDVLTLEMVKAGPRQEPDRAIGGPRRDPTLRPNPLR